MKNLLLCSMFTAFLCFAGPQPVAAQEEGGFGGFMDWIHRLSGPIMVGGSVSAFSDAIGDVGLRGRLNVAWHHSFRSDDKIDPDGSPITMITIRPMVEIPLSPYVEVGIGWALHRFGGDADGFWHSSFPAYLQSRGINLSDVVELRLGLGVQYWLAFDPTDFLPLLVDVELDNGEFTPAAFLGVDLHVF